MKRFLLLLVLASTAALTSAYIAEFGFNLKPCHLCLLQRYPYMVAIGFSALGLWCIRHIQVARITAFLSTLSIAVGSGIAWYHSGVERGIFEGPSGCTSGGSGSGSIDDLRNAILNAPVVACNQPAFEWMGVSMANMNAVYSTLLLAFAFYTLYQTRTERSRAPAASGAVSHGEGQKAGAGDIKK